MQFWVIIMGDASLPSDSLCPDAEYNTALASALSVLSVVACTDTRLIGSGATGTLFKRTRSRPVRKLPATPLQSYIWLLARQEIAVTDLIETVTQRFDAVSAQDLAWVIADLVRDGYLRTGLATRLAEA